MSTTKLPSNIDMADTIVWGLTLRQLIVLGGTCLVAWTSYLGLGSLAPSYAVAAVATLLAGVGVALAFAQPDGLAAERWLIMGLLHLVKPDRRVLAPEGLTERTGRMRSERVGAYSLPVRAVSESGTIFLEDGSWALVCRASALNLELRSASERESLLRGFGRFLNSLDRPIVILVRSERSDLRSLIAHLEQSAGGLPHPDLERAARAYARFLDSLAQRRDLARRGVYLVLRAGESNEDQASAQIRRRADDAAALLRAIGVRVVPLDGQQAAALIARAADPGGPLPLEGQALPGGVVSGVSP